MKSSRSNLDVIRSYLNSERPYPVFGYKAPDIKRKIGDEFTDNKNITWRQENGYKVRVNKQADIIREYKEQKCTKCLQDIKYGSKLDKLFYRKTGLCENCLIDYENKLHIIGVYDDYEKYKLISNEIGFLKETKEKLKDIIKFFSNNSGDIEMVCNSEGFIERWKNTNKIQVLMDSKRDLKLVKERISNLVKTRETYKKNYVAGIKEYNLENYAK